MEMSRETSQDTVSKAQGPLTSRGLMVLLVTFSSYLELNIKCVHLQNIQSPCIVAVYFSAIYIDKYWMSYVLK